MHYCRKCGTRLNKFDEDMCPVCGCKNPFDETCTETVGNTQTIEELGGVYTPKTKKAGLLLGLFLGFTGAMDFYFAKKKNGALCLLFNLIGIAVIALILIFAAKASILLGILVALGVSYLFNIIRSIVVCLTPNLKDGNGEYIR